MRLYRSSLGNIAQFHQVLYLNCSKGSVQHSSSMSTTSLWSCLIAYRFNCLSPLPLPSLVPVPSVSIFLLAPSAVPDVEAPSTRPTSVPRSIVVLLHLQYMASVDVESSIGMYIECFMEGCRGFGCGRGGDSRGREIPGGDVRAGTIRKGSTLTIQFLTAPHLASWGFF